MFKLVKDQLDKPLIQLKAQLERPRSAYDIDVATQNAVLLKLIEKGLLDDSEPKRKGRKPGKAGDSKASDGAASGTGEDSSGDND